MDIDLAELLKDVNADSGSGGPRNVEELLNMLQSAMKGSMADVREPEDGETMAHYVQQEIIEIIQQRLVRLGREDLAINGSHEHMKVYNYPGDESKTIVGYIDGSAHIISVTETTLKEMEEVGEKVYGPAE